MTIIKQFHTPQGIEERELTAEEVMAFGEFPFCDHYGIITTIDTSAMRPIHAVVTYRDVDFDFDCFVTQDLVDQYIGGKIAIGDYVIVCFMENGADKPLASQKIYKTW